MDDASRGEFVRKENVKAFTLRLETEKDPVARQTLTILLAEHGPLKPSTNWARDEAR